MATKIHYAMIAFTAIVATSIGFSPAFAAETSPFSTSLTSTVREYDRDTASNYENDVCINGNIQHFKQTVSNWANSDRVTFWYDTGVRGSDCATFSHMLIQIYVNGGAPQYSLTSYDETDTVVVNYPQIKIPNDFNVQNTVTTTFLEWF